MQKQVYIRRATIHSILTKSSIRAFCPDVDPGMDDFAEQLPIPMMAIEPWQEQLNWQDGKFEDAYNPQHPSYPARRLRHHLNQRLFIANMYWYHHGATTDQLTRHRIRQDRIVSQYLSAAWNAVSFDPEETDRPEIPAA